MSVAGVTLDTVRAAQQALRPYLHRTPLVRSEYLSRAAGADVWLKLENQQKTGSFKPRGALVSMLALAPEERARGVITISAGNHAAAVAWAGRVLGVPVTVVMPAAASPVKVEATRGYGAEVILHGDVARAFERLEEVRSERGLALVHPFDSAGAVTGQATVGLEVVEDLPDVDVVLAGIGGGGLAAGVAFALKALRPGARFVGVEPSGAPAMRRSLDADRPVRLETTATIADGLAAPFAGALPFAIGRSAFDDVVLVEDHDIVEGMRVLLERVKTVAEPAGAAATAALLCGAVRPLPGCRVVAVVSGGNIAAAALARHFA